MFLAHVLDVKLYRHPIAEIPKGTLVRGFLHCSSCNSFAVDALILLVQRQEGRASIHSSFIHLFCKKQLTERNCTVKLENWFKYYNNSNIQLQIKLQVQIGLTVNVNEPVKNFLSYKYNGSSLWHPWPELCGIGVIKRKYERTTGSCRELRGKQNALAAPSLSHKVFFAFPPVSMEFHSHPHPSPTRRVWFIRHLSVIERLKPGNVHMWFSSRSGYRPFITPPPALWN